jgi:hypothetical protein
MTWYLSTRTAWALRFNAFSKKFALMLLDELMNIVIGQFVNIFFAVLSAKVV